MRYPSELNPRRGPDFDGAPAVACLAICGKVWQMAAAVRYNSRMTSAHAPTAHGRRCRRTLIVEDDRVSRRALELLARASGHETRSAATVAEALDQLEAWAPDCVVLDLMLPDGSGAAVLRRVRTAGLPVRVAVASGAFGPVLDEAESLRPDALLRKPMDPARLIAWLDADVGDDDDVRPGAALRPSQVTA